MTSPHRQTRYAGILMRLLRDKRGDTLAIMAAMLVPMVAFSGVGIDTARLYVVKGRLQQACDAGVLAGRKAMTDTSASGTALDSDANAQAQAFFKNNFVAGWYQTTAVDFKTQKAIDGSTSTVANSVTGQATATVPMAVMSFFGKQPVKIDVICQARYDLADNDIMFVLDTTGSMSCTPSDADNCATNPASFIRSDGTLGWYNPEKSGSKIDALRDAVVQFDTVMRQNADSTTHFRYGFVPYSSNVNVGYSIPSQYVDGNASYSTRTITADYTIVGNATQVYPVTNADCTAAAKRGPQTGYQKGMSYKVGSNGAVQMNYYAYASFAGTPTWSSNNGGTCSGTIVVKAPVWTYAPTAINSAVYKTGAEVTNPSRLDGTKSKWQGCIEELATTPGSNFTVTSLPPDLDPDVEPSSATGFWKPAWPDVIWARMSNPQNLNEGQFDEDEYSWPGYYANFSWGLTKALGKNGSAACPAKAQRLKTMTASEVQAYIDGTDFRPSGSTYHDYGMIWGTRFLSPDSVFGDSKAWAGRNDPTRSIVFMTDGTPSTNTSGYGLYGVEAIDNRVNGGDTSEEAANHTTRFRLECDVAKSKGITIYVVALGTKITSDLTYCASPGQTYQASSKDQLTAAFKSIATKVAMLRITK